MLFTVNTVNAQGLSLDSYTSFLIELEFKNALDLAEKSENSPKRDLAINLAEILYNGGQSPLENQISHTIKPKTSEEEALHLLVRGYYNLYYNVERNSSSNYFLESYAISKEIGSESLKKISLLAILEFYHFVFHHTNSQYLKYLNDYEELATTEIEKTWFYLYQYYFEKQNINTGETLENNGINKIIEVNNILPEKSNIRPLLQSLIAVNQEINNNFNTALKNHNEIITSVQGKPFLKYLAYRSQYRKTAILQKKNKYQAALKAIDSARIYVDITDLALSEQYISYQKSSIYGNLEEYKLAYIHLRKYDSLRNNANFKDNQLLTSALETELNTREKEKQILEEQAQKKRNQNIAIGLATSLLLLSIIAILIHRNTKRKQRIAEQEKALQIQKTTTILKEQEINTINAMIAGQEKERLRLARDLHDNLGGTLAAVKMHIGNLQHNLTTTKNPEELLDKANHLISEAYTSVRSIAHERNSGVMAKDGLLPAVQNLANKVSSSSGLEINVEAFGLDERISNNLEITIFRIIQELVTNIIKHAAATEANISLTQHENELNIFVEDNGCGFIVGKLTSKDGMGLGSIERRIEHLEGTMQVDSALGKGTNIIVDIPIK